MPTRQRAWVGVVALIIAGTAGFWVWSRPARHLAKAELLIDDGEPHKALEWLDLPESTAATRERALLLRTRVAVESRDLAEAVRALDLVREDGPRSAEFAYWKGRTLYEARQPLLALGWFEKAWKLRTDDVDAARWVACAAYDLGDRAATAKALETVARLAPKDARVWRTLGTIFLENVKYEEARPAFEQSLALDRNQPNVRLELAEVCVKLGDADAAIEELKKCKGRVPEGRRAELLSECLRMQGDMDGFQQAVTGGLAAAPDHPGLLALQSTVDLAKGDADQSLLNLNRSLTADPYRAQTYYQRGLVLRRLGRPIEAEADVERSATLNKNLAEMSALNDHAAKNPHDPGLMVQIGKLCVDLGKIELAASWFRGAIACEPKHEVAKSELSKLRLPQMVRSRGLTY